MKILLIDDDQELLAAMERLLKGWGYEIATAASGEAGLKAALAYGPGVVLLDMKMPGLSGLEVLERLRAEQPQAEVFMVTGEDAARSAVEALRLGAEDYLVKPVEPEELKLVLEKAEGRALLKAELHELRARDRLSLGHLFLRHPSMTEVYSAIERVAAAGKVTVLIQGETGTGKEHAARLIHHYSPRGSGPFVELHCAALPETLLESELFCFEAGAFTDAKKAKAGLMEQANGGTLFLDEVGELPLVMQTKLLKVLEDKQLRRLGGLKPISLDLRLVAATNRDLDAEVKAGRFRADLYYRIKVFSLNLPPLREHPEDIEILARHFAAKFSEEMGRKAGPLDEELVERLRAYAWPGNIRELRNTLERLVILSGEAGLRCDDLPEEVRRSGAAVAAHPSKPLDAAGDELLTLMEKHRWHRSRAAEELGVSRPTLLKRLRAAGLA